MKLALVAGARPNSMQIGAGQPRPLELLYTLYRPVLDQTFPSPRSLPRPEGLGAVALIRESGGESPSTTQ